MKQHVRWWSSSLLRRRSLGEPACVLMPQAGSFAVLRWIPAPQNSKSEERQA